VLILIFAVQQKLLPVAGFKSLQNLILPSVTLGLGFGYA
jgi:peptide/nickel transport system permease protein